MTALSPTESTEALCRRARDEFESRFGRPATIVVAAPGRVNLIGEHIDYNDGFVLPMAIERYVVIAADTNDDDAVRLYSVDLRQDAAYQTGHDHQPGEKGWSKYPQGVLAGFAGQGIDSLAFDAAFTSNVPLGGGLSSSAALEVATATLVEAISGKTLGLADKALLAQKAEHDFAGVPCGIMDQFSSVFGRDGEFMLLDCRSQEIEAVPFARDDVSIVITNSNVKHELAGGEYAQRRQQCDEAKEILGAENWRDVTADDLARCKDELGDERFRRARHIIGEIARTLETANALRNGDLDTVGRLMYDSHNSLRDDYEVSCGELDCLVDLAEKIGPEGGVYGSRMTGGGFGGCTVSLVDSAKASDVIAAMADGYEKATGKTADAFASRPARGAHLVQNDRG
ncbi:galactokinase [Crateriforma conspicua]|uniref:Galactokinase n=1 Tax=Crateriforma conspicua TaxID=2527996 RepID=A0A5C5Y2G2_9PLAN|nr:galactokinase [Crateriforma conspicua]TWT68999.1 Galactokinase [Crateriforma conspicua]